VAKFGFTHSKPTFFHKIFKIQGGSQGPPADVRGCIGQLVY